VLCLQEVDVGQPRSHLAHQARAVAAALAAPHWRFAPTLAGVPGPRRAWHPVVPVALGASVPGGLRPLFGNAVVSRTPVLAWHVLGLGSSRARLPVRAAHPASGTPAWWWVPDEPRVALAAELDGVTVVCTHLSFWPPAAVRQLRRLRSWSARLPGPVVVAGDLNLPGTLPARLLGGTSAVRTPTYPAGTPRVQLDHVVLPVGCRASAASVRRLNVGDHRAVVVAVGY
jgi:endonuclease/exonuclease/phosphatase family metal-dependent hydrolase